MSTLPTPYLKQLREDFGPEVSRWPEGLRDLLDTSIEAVPVAPPLSGRVARFLNTDFYYYWAKDVCGANPDHSRVEEMRAAGWDFADTDDVSMASADTVKSPDKKRKSRGHEEGYSNEIRSGDRRLMKLPMRMYRQKRKAELMQALQYQYPRAFGAKGQPMSTENLIPGITTTQLDAGKIDEMVRRAVVSDPAKELQSGNITGNAAVANVTGKS